MPEPQRDESARHRRLHAAHERLEHPGTGAPGDVKSRHRVAMTGRKRSAAFGPPDDGKEAHAQRVQPRALLRRGKLDVRLGPPLRPCILVAIEARRAEPVAPGELTRVVDAEAPLLRRVHEEQTAERPERLPAEGRLGLLLDNDDAAARVGQLRGGDEAGESRTDDDRVGRVVRPSTHVRDIAATTRVASRARPRTSGTAGRGVPRTAR
jgi:hypothetical protein